MNKMCKKCGIRIKALDMIKTYYDIIDDTHLKDKSTGEIIDVTK